ncbi:MAG: hypothetical protein NTW38_02985 [Candidatus Aminicenantes bacterium]|nr:hypothetical protein [Candidatus Aminicenantes bacterium]
MRITGAHPRIDGTIENPPVPSGETPIVRSKAAVRFADWFCPRAAEDNTVASAGIRAVGSG